MQSIEELIMDADFDSTESQIRLAEYYTKEATFNFDSAEKWLKILVVKKSLYAKYELHHLYNEGRGSGLTYHTDNNLAASKKLLIEAAGEKHIQALYDLSLIELQSNTTYDNGLARMIESSTGGHKHACSLLEKYEYKLPFTLDMAANGDLNNEESDYAKKLARDLYLSIELGNLGVIVRLAMVGDFFNARKLYDEAFIWYEKAAKLGNTDAAFNLATLHLDYKVTQASADEAFHLLEPLARKKDSDALHLIAKIYLQKKKYAHAIAYFKLSADAARDANIRNEESGYAENLIKKHGDTGIAQEAKEIYQYHSR